MRDTPTKITELKENEVFVFGSNLQGKHIGGAARTAIKWGAIMGEGVGLHGRTYAIPTIGNINGNTLTVNDIMPYVDDFINFAILHPELTFLVTEIGCGIAGHKHKDIAPLFTNAVSIENICLPLLFRNVINNKIE